MRERELLGCLAELARICANRPDRASFASSLVLQVLRPFEARSAAVGMIDSQSFLDVRTMFGFPTGMLRDGPRYALDSPIPLADSVRRGTVVEGEVPELTARYAGLEGLDLPGTHIICLPLLARGATIGGMALAMDVAPAHEQNRVFWAAVADLVSATISSAEPAAVAPRDRPRRSAPLSARQREILEHLQAGRTNGQIARAMNFGTSTIGHDIMRIFDVLGVESRRQAVTEAERAGLLAPREDEPAD
ncbi:MAG: LuxR C-terminal-related transcriptional regulator [Microcella sp.]|uniref:LuxR C-terminal-related transcriptional regulator n=1 Tax=Microcella sp. TaxID=1913979 RepID=UPI002717FCEF|nr:LuxR C-terminal-related transcriptional regulator [Microcella sp.]MDO8338047.1 LuxR C-terminal-related transcriptional regulator [Microcella sp.]